MPKRHDVLSREGAGLRSPLFSFESKNPIVRIMGIKGNTKMKNGDKVCIRLNVKGKETWKHGYFLSHRDVESAAGTLRFVKVGVGEPHYFNYYETEVPSYNVKQYMPLEEDKATFHHNADLVLAVEAIQTALAKLMPDETIKIEDGIIYANYGLSLCPVVHDVHTIARVVATPLWQVCMETSIPATRHEPECGDVSEIGSPMHWQFAVALFVEELFKLKANAYWEHLRESEYAKEVA